MDCLRYKGALQDLLTVPVRFLSGPADDKLDKAGLPIFEGNTVLLRTTISKKTKTLRVKAPYEVRDENDQPQQYIDTVH